jgi:hypothetical protein
MPNSYSGVWRAGSGPYYLWANVTWDSFRAKWQELSAKHAPSGPGSPYSRE